MKAVAAILIVLSLTQANAAGTIKMSFNNEEINKVIQVYSKASGQKFIVDPGVRGKISIYQPDDVTIEEAFNQLSTALAINGFAISKQGDMMVIKSARNIQRDYLDVSSERPAIKPERMFTWIYTAKNLPVETINRDIRIFSSKDGEMVAIASSNQLIFTDWATNINRIADIMKEIDKPLDASTLKLVEVSKKVREDRNAKAATATKNGKRPTFVPQTEE